MRIYRAEVPQRAEGKRLDDYLGKAMPLLPQHVIRDALKNKDVKMDGKRAGRDAVVSAGAVIEVYTPFLTQIPVVYEDDRVLIVNKPAGISCDDDDWGGMTVLSAMQERAGDACRVRLCHRLDHPTCGLLLLCKDDESERVLLDAFKDRKLTKIYQCLARGEMRPPAAVKEAYLIKDASSARVRIVTHATPGALPIATQYETMEYDGVLSRLRVTLLTGRTHQIRAHMAFLSHPLLGDDKYGDRDLNRRMKAVGSLKLCATELTLRPGGALAYLDGKTFAIDPPF
ncbi:MAG: RluA family pseudouridine synthase [Clostridia bacterium]|nr:RluA family pseudouridine synthase [Clostridia bacterium]